MGTFNWPVTVISADGARRETVEALVDTGATYTSLPASLLERLGIQRGLQLDFTLADGSVLWQDTGRARLSINGVAAYCTVLFAEDDLLPLLGAETLERIELVVDPVRERLLPFWVLRI